MAQAYACSCTRASVVSNRGVKLAPDEWLDDGATTDSGRASIEQRFWGVEANPHASGPLRRS